MGHFGRPEDTFLGPPKLGAFASASRKPAAETPGRGERWTRDRDADGARDKPSAYTVKGRKSLGQDDFDRGFGQNQKRGRREEGNAKDKDIPGGQGGWRDRERDTTRNATANNEHRESNKDRDWGRGAKVEEDPEWMETRGGKEKKQAHTQEEFQRWKEQMRAKDAPAREEPPPEPSVPTPVTVDQPDQPAFTPSAVDPAPGSFFGAWGLEKPADSKQTTAAVPRPVKEKKSKFANMFKAPSASQPPTPVSVPVAEPPAPAKTGGEDEDKEGFQRILQMLGGTNISGPPPGLQRKPSPEQLPESRPHRQQVPRTQEQQSMLENILAPRSSAQENRLPQARGATMSPPHAFEHFTLPRPESTRMQDDSPFGLPPQRNTSAQEATLHQILHSRTQGQPIQDPYAKQQNRDFLIELMRGPSRGTPPMGQNHQRPPLETHNSMPLFEQAAPRHHLPHQQVKGRGVPPQAFMDDPRYVNENELMRREQAQMREANLRELARQQQREEVMRRNNHLPAGFNPNQDDPTGSLQRRNTAGELPRQMTNMGIPSQPDMSMFGGRNQGMPSAPQDRPNIAPPPGFGQPAGVRQPPGLGLNGPPSIPSYSAGNNTPGMPPGFGPPPGNMRGMFGGPGQNQMPPQGPPQGPPGGYFPPHNYGPPMPMRGEDPRMMGRPDFEQFGPGSGRGQPGQGQGGRPPYM